MLKKYPFCPHQDSVINRGLISRSVYASNTELVARYTALGVNEALITEEEGLFLRQLAFKAEKKFPKITEEEFGRAKRLQIALRDALEQTDFSDLQTCLSGKEIVLVKKITDAFLHHKKITAEEAHQMEPLISKMACRGIKAGTILALFLNASFGKRS